MRFASLPIAGLLLSGCAASKPQEQAQPTVREYQERAATALAFTPPSALGSEHIDLSRAEREPAIFVGFDALSETFFYIRTDDRFTNDGSDRYLRRSIQERIGVSYR